MRRPPFGIVLIHGDGSRVVRLNVPRWLGYASLTIPGAALACLLGIFGVRALIDYQRAQIDALRHRVAAQSQVLEGVRAGVATVRGELTRWSNLHARMWEALGPEGGTGSGDGVGGPALPVGPPVAAGPADELRLLLDMVAEESPRLRELHRLVQRTGEMVDALPLRWPVRGRVSSEFGRRPSPWGGALEHHRGLDIGTPAGTPILSPAAGRVVVAGWGGDFGRHVVVDHGGGVRSLYGHLGKVSVRAGQAVEAGDVLGVAGSSGRSTGPHLHYEVHVNGMAVDPRAFLWERATSHVVVDRN